MISGQTRASSLAEALANVAVGYLLAIATQQLLFPLFGFEASLGEHGAIAAVFTLISLCRSYLLRRLFSRIEQLRAVERERKARSLSRRFASRGLREANPAQHGSAGFLMDRTAPSPRIGLHGAHSRQGARGGSKSASRAGAVGSPSPEVP